MRGLSALLGLLALLLSACAPTATATPTTETVVTPTPQPTATQKPPNPIAVPPVAVGTVAATVTRVIDGDTIEVNIGGTNYTVRYIGMDTPETKHAQVAVECFGAEATQHNRTLMEGQTVYLEKDLSETDRYDRLLRYVWLPDGRMVNEVLVAEGYAQVSTFPPDVRYTDRFLEAQRQAREAGRGLWAMCMGAPTPSPTAKPVSTLAPAATPTPAPSGNCDPAYPTVCIPPPPPDLDCKDVPYKNFQVLSPDPHRFDVDKNGIGCES